MGLSATWVQISAPFLIHVIGNFKIQASIYSIAGVIRVLPGGEYHPKFKHW